MQQRPQTAAWFRICSNQVTRACGKAPACEGRISAGTAFCGEAVSRPGLPSLGLKRSQAEQGQPVWMRLAGHQLAWALAIAFGTSATQEAAVVDEEAQQVQVGAAQMAAQGEVAAQP